MSYEVTDTEGNDLLGCEQPDAATARVAARQMIEDGHDAVDIYRLIDGEREGIARSRVSRNEHGEIVERTTSLGL